MSTDQEYDSHQARSTFDEPEDESQPGNLRSPEELQGQYPSQFDQHQSQQHGEYYQQAHGIAGTQQQMAPPTSHPGAGEFEDPNHMLDADPFGLGASMHYPQTYATQQYHDQR